MVKRILLVLCLLSSFDVAAKSVSLVSADDLEKWAGYSDQEIKAKKERIKASDLSSTFYTSKKVRRRVFYRKPDGTMLIGYILPNGKVAPAYMSGITPGPGCYADDGKVYNAEWIDNALYCHLPQIGMVKAHKESFTVQKENPGTVFEKDSAVVGSDDAVQRQSGDKGVVSAKRKGSKYSNRDLSDDGSDKSTVLTDVVIESQNNGVGNQVAITSTASKKASRRTKNVKSEPQYMTPVQIISTPSSSLMADSNDEYFGIPFGQWVKARLERVVTNADNGQIELIIEDDVIGKAKTLSRDTIAFAQKRYNARTKRMDLTVSRGIGPDDQKIAFSAVAYDASKVSGLPGILERDRGGEVKSAFGKSALRVAGSVVSTVTGDDLAGQASDSVANQMLANEERYMDGNPNALIRVYPQIVYLRIVESF